ncbi:MAG: DUF4145 domain-containing protein [Actinomycetota bacterium]
MPDLYDAPDDERLPETLPHHCGWCNTRSFHRLLSARRAGKHIYLSQGDYVEEPLIAAIYQCGGCEMGNLLVWSLPTWKGPQLEEAWPHGRAEDREELGDPLVRRDRLEALNSQLQGQHLAAVVMARSALQRTARILLAEGDKGGGRGKRLTLEQELDLLVERRIITPQLRANADEVRLTGNDVAHPEELEAVTAEDAVDSLAFLEDFLETTLAIPNRQRARKAEREGDAPRA